jgi:hypothetical protein
MSRLIWSRDFPASLANTGNGRFCGASNVATIAARSRWIWVWTGWGR